MALDVRGRGSRGLARREPWGPCTPRQAQGPPLSPPTVPWVVQAATLLSEIHRPPGPWVTQTASLSWPPAGTCSLLLADGPGGGDRGSLLCPSPWRCARPPE